MKVKSFAIRIGACAIEVACAGCRILETGYGDDNVVVRTSTDAVSSATGAVKSTVAWAGASILSFADDMGPDEQAYCIRCGELAASAYRNKPDLPEGFRPLSADAVARLGLPQGRYSYEEATGYLEDVDGTGFGARLLESSGGSEVVVAYRGSNAPGEDADWAQDWLVDVQQGGGGLPVQYVRGAEVLAAVRRAYPETRVSVAGHSLGGGIAAYSVLELPSVERVMCRTYNAAGISVISLQSFARERVEGAKSVIANVRSKGDPVSAIPGTQLVGAIYEVDNLRFANHSIDGLLVDMRRRAAGRRAGWLRDLMDD